jgi:Chaperone of endosialidase
MNRIVLFSVGAVLGLLCLPVHAEVLPQIINYQGRVVVGGANFNGTGQFKFALVNGSNSSSTATASAIISSGVIQGVVVTATGNGYTSAPPVSIIDPAGPGGGSGACATATVSFGHVTGIDLCNGNTGGSNYGPGTYVAIGNPPSNLNFTYWSNDGTSTNGMEPGNAVSIGVSNGLYSVLLGDTSLPNMTAVPNTIVDYSDADMRLRVWFNDGTHGFQLLSPDQRIASIIYAFGAAAVGDPSTGAVVFAKNNQLEVQGPGGIKLKTGGHGTGVILTTDFSSFGGNLLNVNSDATFSGDVSANSFNATSDRNAKEQFRPVNAREILSHLATLPIQTWNFKQGDSGVQHIGPMAQDFYAAFQVGPDDKHITTVDADGVAFAAIQGLNEIAQEQNAELAAKAKKIDALEKRLDEIEKSLKRAPSDKVK